MQRSRAILPKIHICLAGLPRKVTGAYENPLFFYHNYDGSPVRKRQEGYGEGKDGIGGL
ncbi:MAG: hypothetical protein J1F42_12280 [Lachnospiraceae bacterium]|nr:hypothetical protein [Lachnospiraceae bacterium]